MKHYLRRNTFRKSHSKSQMLLPFRKCFCLSKCKFLVNIYMIYAGQYSNNGGFSGHRIKVINSFER